MTKAFRAASLENEYAFIDACPEQFIDAIVTLPFGHLRERVAALVAWRACLMRGELPDASDWPSPHLAAPVVAALRELGLVRFCKDQGQLVDDVLHDVLQALGKQHDAFASGVAQRLHELEEQERRRLSHTRVRRGKRKVALNGATRQRLREQAENDELQRSRDPDAGLKSAYEERVRCWSDLAEVFGDLGEMLGRGWDLSRSILRHVGWSNVLELRRLVEQLPQLRDIVRSLGRLQTSLDEQSTYETIMSPVRRLEEERREVRSPRVPAELRGITRSGDVARMLPVEAVMLGHATLRLLWHARRAERALLTYRFEGTETERVLSERELVEQREVRRPRPQRGPIVAVIDTSGSMHGLPEQVAKALVLEAMRVAHSEKRRCFLYAYSGPGDVIEHELDLGADGIGRLLTFLAHTFGGGTDIGAMSMVVERLKDDSWKKADVILVSDGEWHAPPNIVTAAQTAKGHGTRFHGVQIGNRGHTGMHALCEPVHVFQDWATAGGW